MVRGDPEPGRDLLPRDLAGVGGYRRAVLPRVVSTGVSRRVSAC